MGYLYILATIALTVYGQLALKWRVNRLGEAGNGGLDKIAFLFKALMDPFVLSGLAAAFAASLFWMLAMTKFQLSYAYPFMSLSYVAVLFLSAVLFHEAVTWPKLAGLALVVVGLALSSQSG